MTSTPAPARVTADIDSDAASRNELEAELFGGRSGPATPTHFHAGRRRQDRGVAVAIHNATKRGPGRGQRPADDARPPIWRPAKYTSTSTPRRTRRRNPRPGHEVKTPRKGRHQGRAPASGPFAIRAAAGCPRRPANPVCTVKEPAAQRAAGRRQPLIRNFSWPDQTHIVEGWKNSAFQTSRPLNLVLLAAAFTKCGVRLEIRPLGPPLDEA